MKFMRSLSIKENHKRVLKKSLYFIFLFGTVKISSLFAALFSSNLVSDINDYGIFEYALTFGGIASIIMDVGGNGSYPYFSLKKGEQNYDAVFYAHYLPFIVLGIALLIFLHLFNLSDKISLCVLLTLILGMQSRLSTIFKSRDFIFYSLLCDGGLFLVINLYNIFVYINHTHFILSELLIVLFIYTIILSLFFGAKYYLEKEHFNLEKYKAVLKWGYKIVLSSFLIIFLTSSARILIENLLGLQQVAEYSFYFRLACITVMLHQAINIFFFKKIYTSDPRILDKYLSWFFIIIMLLGLMVWEIVPFIFQPFFKLLRSYSIYDKQLFLILSFQVYFWIVMATFENIIYREDLSSKMNVYFFFILMLFLGLPFIFKYYFTLNILGICFINMLCLFICTEVQFYCLKIRGIYFKKSHIFNYAVLALFTVIYCFLIY